ncbi:MAG: tripartite tricarboxylate transporter substrate binding protein [Pseudomonadota bacterium]
MVHVLRRLAVLAMGAAVALGSGAAGAQAAWPNQAVRVVVGFPAGTTGDLLMRIVAPKLGEALGQPVLVENRPGAGSSIAADAVAHARPDGYTLLLSTTANVINPSLFPKLPFDFVKDLVPVMVVGEAPALLVTSVSSPVTTVAGLVAAAKAKPGAMTFASSGNGTFTHLYGELFNQQAGVQLLHVPYKGSSQAVTDLLAGQVDLLFTPASTVIPHVKAGKLRALGTIGHRRLAALPDVPTFAEAHVAGFDSALWFGLNAPRGTPPAVVQRLAKEVTRVLALPEVREQLTAQSIDAVASSPASFGNLIRDEGKKWAAVIKAADIKVE